MSYDSISVCIVFFEATTCSHICQVIDVSLGVVFRILCKYEIILAGDVVDGKGNLLRHPNKTV